MLDAMNRFYETSYANVHRGVYALAERATEAFEGARQKLRAFINAPGGPRGRSSPATRRRDSTSSRTRGGSSNLGPGDLVLVTELEHHSNFVPWQYIAKRTGAGFRMIPLDEHGELRARRPRRARPRRGREGRREQPRLQLARHDQPGREARGLGARARRDHGRGRRPGGAAPQGRRPGARLRLPRVLGAQDVRPQRRRSGLGAARAARGDGAVQPRRAHDPQGRVRGDDLGRACRTSSRRGRRRSPRPSGSAPRSTT